MKNWFGHMGQQGIRIVLLVGIITLSGIGLGLAAGYPLSQIKFEESDSVRLDQSRLAGEVDPAAALVEQGDLPLGWEPGDPVIAGFGLLGSSFCGDEVPLPTALSEKKVIVFANPADQAYLVAEAVRVDRWQSARAYVDDLADAVGGCDEFFRVGLGGERVKVEIREGTGDPPITDYVSRTFVADDGSSVQTWSVMAVGDVVVAIQYLGPSRPQEGFLADLEDKVLIRVDPLDFAPGGIATTSTSSTVPADPTQTTVIDDGAADETEANQQPEGTEAPSPDGSVPD